MGVVQYGVFTTLSYVRLDAPYDTGRFQAAVRLNTYMCVYI